MAGYRIRRGEVELYAPDQDALKRMVDEGQITPTDEAWWEGGWIPLAQLPEDPPRPKEDPWSAWGDVDAVDAEAVVRSYTARDSEPAELPVDALTPMARPIVVHSRTRAPAADFARDRDAPPVVAPPHGADRELRSPDFEAGANVISFPRMQRPSQAPERSGSATLPGPPGIPLVRLSRLIPMLGIGGIIVFFGWMYVEIIATPPPFARAPVTRSMPKVASDPFTALERQLRSVTLGDPRTIHTADQFSDALTLELQQLGVTAERVDVNVTRWRGRRQNEPAVAEIHVRLATSAHLELALGAIALAVGRYKQALVCEIPVFDVRVPGGDSARLKALDAARAEEFTRGRITLAQYLESLSTSPPLSPAEGPPPTE